MRKAFFVLAVIVTFSGCDFDYNYNSGKSTKSFESKLQGEWESEAGSKYTGTIIIEYSTIKIIGFGENQTPKGENDDQRPFKNITRNVNLTGYSEEGKIYIEDFGTLKDGISYDYTASSGDELLRFTFGGREQRMIKVEEDGSDWNDYD